MRSFACLVTLALSAGGFVVAASAQPPPTQPAAQPAAQPPAQPAAQPAAAQPAAQPRPPAGRGGLADAREPEAIRAALEQAGVMRNRAAVAAVAARIRDGLSPELLDEAIDTLVGMSRPEAVPVLAELAAHRRPGVRRKALDALASMRLPGAEPALARALDDADPTVRAAAARAIGRGGVRSPQIIEALFTGVAQQMPEAATALGQVVRPAMTPRVLALVEQHSFDVVSLALAELLRRRDVSTPQKLQIVSTLAAIDRPGVRTFLQQFASSIPEGDPMRRQVETAMTPRAAPAPAAPAPAAPSRPAPAAAPPAAPAPAAAPAVPVAQAGGTP
jgi:hypothetical protein